MLLTVKGGKYQLVKELVVDTKYILYLIQL